MDADECILLVSLQLWNAAPRPGENVAVQLLADSLDMEANLLEFFVRENFTSIEDVGRLHHRLVNSLVVEILEVNVFLVRERKATKTRLSR